MGYRAMKQLRDAIAKVHITDKELWFSTCNLSYDYNDDDSAVSLVELDTTARIVLGFIGSFFTTLADTGSENPNKEPAAQQDVSEKPEAQIDVLAVAGAGHADANGIYIREPPHVQKGGRPVWTHEIDDKYKIQWSKMMSHWMIDQVGGPSPYCMQGGDDALPVGGTWVIYERSGTLPNPSVEPIGTAPAQKSAPLRRHRSSAEIEPPSRIGTAPAQKSSASFDQHALAQKFQRGEALAGGFFKGDRIQYRNERSGTVTGPAAKKARHNVSVAYHFDDSQPFAQEDVRVAHLTRV